MCVVNLLWSLSVFMRLSSFVVLTTILQFTPVHVAQLDADPDSPPSLRFSAEPVSTAPLASHIPSSASSRLTRCLGYRRSRRNAHDYRRFADEIGGTRRDTCDGTRRSRRHICCPDSSDACRRRVWRAQSSARIRRSCFVNAIPQRLRSRSALRLPPLPARTVSRPSCTAFVIEWLCVEQCTAAFCRRACRSRGHGPCAERQPRDVGRGSLAWLESAAS